MVALKYLPECKQEILQAQAAAEALARLARADKNGSLRLVDARTEERVEMPAPAIALLVDIMADFAKRRAITLIAADAELDEFEAADILMVSRPYFLKLLEAGRIPYQKDGGLYRVRMDDLMEYKVESKRKREAILDQMVAEAQELGLYD